MRSEIEFVGGTASARSLFDQLRESGALQVPYRESWVIENGPLFGGTIEGFRNQMSSPNAPHDLIFIDLSNTRDQRLPQLLEIFPKLKEVFSLTDFMTNPDFLVLNLSTKQLLVMGLGRKDSVFVKLLIGENFVSVAESEYIDFINQSFDVDEDSEIAVDPIYQFLQQFCSNDIYDLVDKLWESCQEYGTNSYRFQSLLGSIPEIEEARENGENSDGFYEIDGEELSESELDELENEYQECEEAMQEASEVLLALFPKLEPSELITGAY